MDAEELEKARLNRERVARHENEAYYTLIEKTVRLTPIDKPLPPWIPMGNLPALSEKEFKQALKEFKDSFVVI